LPAGLSTNFFGRLAPATLGTSQSVTHDSSPIIEGENTGWGFGVSVLTKPDGLATRAGRYGWNGGLGSSWWNDPNERLTAIIVTERTFESADPPNVIKDFWKSAYEAVRTGS